MPNWSDHLAIKRELSRKWDTGQILRNVLKSDNMFPLRIKLKGPTSEEMSMHFAQMLDWIDALRRNDKAARGYGYVLEEKEKHHRLTGKNTVPTHVVIPTLDDAVQFLTKQTSLQLFKDNAGQLLHEWECLLEWVLKNPFQVVTIGENIHSVLQVLRWFAQHEQRNLYIRQLDIEGVDTKFIETHKKLFIQLLDVVLPQCQINQSGNSIETRYGLKTKPKLIRLRILDESLALYGCEDITLPMEQLGLLHIPFKHVFIVENEINFLCFPALSNACVIFGGGYKIDLLKGISWLYDKEIYYWGDIDTHGMNILSMARSFLPQTRSFLMSMDILQSHRPLWVEEEVPFRGKFLHLTASEQELALRLQQNFWGVGVRLEQERIRFSEVEKFVATLS